MNVDELTLEQLRVAIAELLGWRWMRHAGDHLTMLVPPGAYQLGSTKDGKPWLVPSTADAERYKDWDTLIWTGAISERLPNWPADIGAADALLDDLESRGAMWGLESLARGGYQLFVFGRTRDVIASSAVGKTRPGAICRAWLKATAAQTMEDQGG